MHGRIQTMQILSCGKAERRFQGAVEAIFAWCPRDRVPIRRIERGPIQTGLRVPAQPFCTEIGKMAGLGKIVDSKTGIF